MCFPVARFSLAGRIQSGNFAPFLRHPDMNPHRITLVLSLGLAALAAAQSTISATARHAHAANAGWIDFRTSAADGVVVAENCLSGKAYAANFGWIDLGDGTPANGYSYSNTTAGDFGVNLAATGALSGYAYAANVGWIAFEQAQGQPRLEFATGGFSGYAYSANLGWIALGTSSATLVAASMVAPDADGDGLADAYEMFYCGSLSVMNATSNLDRDAASDLQEYAANTNPTDPASCLRITQQAYNSAHDQVTLTFTTAANRLYSIEQATALAGAWTDSGLSRFAPDAGATSARTINFAAGTRRFFRAVAHRPLQP